MKNMHRTLSLADYEGEGGKEVRVIISGGGTGGHLFPGIAVGSELKKRCGKVSILFITGKREMEHKIISEAGFESKSIDVEGLMGKRLLGVTKAVYKVIVALAQSFFIVKDFRPQLVFGLGGYTSGPVCLMALLFRVPTVLHEQNSFPGLTNRILSPFVKRIFISFEETRRYLRRGKVFLSGNPIRMELLQPIKQPQVDKRFVILVMGGSQGARRLNDAVISMIKELKEQHAVPFLIHQTGKADLKRVVSEYEMLGIDVEVSAFIEDMRSAYSRADLIICRAGATTVAELSALGKPSILIPYPYASHGHQEINAMTLVKVGGADIILERHLDSKALTDKVLRFMKNRNELNTMSEIAFRTAKRKAREIITEELLKIVNMRK
ncbi:MAG: undecaprenyldiphospho-muramoylpentapeptide beta-N-acetylglucosaminyltransferase [Deltaproteobacteria bacterium]|nr:undecaprenyldiphospho-muramoylpentapeptide beta-N-acetylglucosaminyltransferase [Deltaproteobacteria bacterium]